MPGTARCGAMTGPLTTLGRAILNLLPLPGREVIACAGHQADRADGQNRIVIPTWLRANPSLS